MATLYKNYAWPLMKIFYIKEKLKTLLNIQCISNILKMWSNFYIKFNLAGVYFKNIYNKIKFNYFKSK